ncbi:MAG: hypothetical protein IJA52_07125 [Clostridia bacterium]|nr:hypothetical protein [Clostridia bacterium]
MNNQKRPIDPRRGGAARQKQMPPRNSNQNAGQPHHSIQGQRPTSRPRPAARPMPEEMRTQGGYYQMPLRPMTPMPRNANGVQRGQRPPMQGQRPPMQGQRPPMQGQRPPMQGQRPPMQGQRPPMQGQRPPMQGQRPPMQGQRPPMQGQRPPIQRNGQRPEAQKKRSPQSRPNNGWVVPEGSAVYTAEGILYERNTQRRPAPQRKPAEPPKRKKKRFNKEKFLLGTKTFFVRLGVMILVFSLLLGWWYFTTFYSDSSKRRGEVSYSMEDVGFYSEKAAAAYRGDVLYVDFTEISQWFDMISVGSVGAMRFIARDGVSDTSSGKGGEEYVIFMNGQSTVTINGQSIILEAECRNAGSHILVPLSFVENYMRGIEVEKDPKGHNVVFSPEGDDSEEKKDKDEKDQEMAVIHVSFKVKGTVGIAHVEYPE